MDENCCLWDVINKLTTDLDATRRSIHAEQNLKDIPLAKFEGLGLGNAGDSGAWLETNASEAGYGWV